MQKLLFSFFFYLILLLRFSNSFKSYNIMKIMACKILSTRVLLAKRKKKEVDGNLLGQNEC